MATWTIRNCETGAVQITGFIAKTAKEAEEHFYELFPYFDGEVYASEAEWND